MNELIKKNGLAKLYQGLTTCLFTVFTSNFVYFYSYQACKSFWNLWITDTIPATGYLIIAIISGSINVLITNPLWVVNTRLRLQGAELNQKTSKYGNYKYLGILDGIFKVCKSEGVAALWSGTLPSLFLVLNPGIQFMVYELQKNYMQSLMATTDLHATIYFGMGSIAKMMATFSTYPMQIVQTRLRFSKSTTSFLSTFQLLIQLLRVGGFKSMYQGIEAKLWQTIINTALMFTFYEKLVVIVFFILKLENNKGEFQTS